MADDFDHDKQCDNQLSLLNVKHIDRAKSARHLANESI